MKYYLVEGDSLGAMKLMPTDYFHVACFSPPYGTAKDEFHVEHDFWQGGRFFPYMVEVCRVAQLAAINLSQRVVNKKLSTFLEEMTIELQDNANITLFDRWVVVKPFTMPRRGNRALTRFEFVLLYTRHPHHTIRMYAPGSTVLEVTNHSVSVGSGVGVTPYYPEIPRQVISMYSPEGGKVLDPFAGTGTTLKVGLELGREVTGVEYDPNIYAQLEQEVEEAASLVR